MQGPPRAASLCSEDTAVRPTCPGWAFRAHLGQGFQTCPERSAPDPACKSFCGSEVGTWAARGREHCAGTPETLTQVLALLAHLPGLAHPPSRMTRFCPSEPGWTCGTQATAAWPPLLPCRGSAHCSSCPQGLLGAPLGSLIHSTLSGTFSRVSSNEVGGRDLPDV